MINLSKITQALETQLSNNTDLVQKAVEVVRSDYVNESPDRAPWVGVYKAAIRYDPSQLGRHSSSWKAEVDLRLVVQEVDYDTGAKCEDKVEALVQEVLDAIWADPTLDDNVEMITELSIDYAQVDYEESETLYFQEAIVSITAEVLTG